MLMNAEQRILCILQIAIKEVVEVDSGEEALSCSPDTVLLGTGVCLDSMGFVNFIVAVEDSLQREFGIFINLHEELASSTASKDTPLKIADLTVFLTELIRRRHNR